MQSLKLPRKSGKIDGTARPVLNLLLQTTCSSDIFGQNSPRQPFIIGYRAKFCLGEARKFFLVTNTLRYAKILEWGFRKQFFLKTCLRYNLCFFHHVFRVGKCDIFARWRKFLRRVFHLREFLLPSQNFVIFQWRKYLWRSPSTNDVQNSWLILNGIIFA